MDSIPEQYKNFLKRLIDQAFAGRFNLFTTRERKRFATDLNGLRYPEKRLFVEGKEMNAADFTIWRLVEQPTRDMMPNGMGIMDKITGVDPSMFGETGFTEATRDDQIL